MRHQRRLRRLGRNRAKRQALLRGLVRALVSSERISTTLAKGKEASRLFDRLVTLGKEKTVSARRRAYRVLGDRSLVKVLFDEVAPRYSKRSGGYARLVRSMQRAGDGADLAVLEMVEKKPVSAPAKLKKEKKPSEPTASAKPSVLSTPEAPKDSEARQALSKTSKKASKTGEEKKKGFLSGLRNLFRSKRDPDET